MRDSNAGKRFLHPRKYCRLGWIRLCLRELGVVSLLILKGNSMKIWISESWNLVKIERFGKNCEICLKFRRVVGLGDLSKLWGWVNITLWMVCLWALSTLPLTSFNIQFCKTTPRQMMIQVDKGHHFKCWPWRPGIPLMK